MSDFPFFRVDHDVDDDDNDVELLIISRMVEVQNYIANTQVRRQRAECPPGPNLHNLDEASSDPIMKAVKQNDKNKLIQILKKHRTEPVPLLAETKNWTALHLAASKPEYKECLELLLEYDNCSILVNRDNQTNLGETALLIACEYGCDENVLILLQNGCDPRKKTHEGYSALHIAASKGYIKIVQYLLDYSVDIDSTDKIGCTPLHLAAKAGYSDLSEILLANGANIASVDYDDGNLPLHLACECGTIETACLLLKHDLASINAKNFQGVTPLMLAIGNFDMHGIQYLLENGARTDLRDDFGRMALHFAAYRNLIQIFSLLIQSTNENHAEQCCVSNIIRLLNRKTRREYSFDSYTCLSTQMGPDYLNVLMKSHLPKSILQMPSLYYRSSHGTISVLSPLACLFFTFNRKTVMEFDQCLDLLLKHKITRMDEFQIVLQRNWPTIRTRFVNPLAILISSRWPNINREHYFNLLIANNVTTDYCLQCYHDNNKPFATFNDYRAYYGPVIYALEEEANIEVVKLLLSNSVILEPNILCKYLVMAYTVKWRHITSKDTEVARSLYRYLLNLRPMYYEWGQQCNSCDSQELPSLPGSENIINEVLSFYSDSCFGSSLFSSIAYFGFLPPILRAEHHIRSFPYITSTEEFAGVTLQQLCRTTIRQNLRETTLEDNLRNFRRKILELPLPNLLKDYLLFKDSK